MIEFLQGYVETALWALVFSCIIVKLVSSAVDSDGTKGVREIDAESFDIVKVVDEDEGEVIVEKVQMVEQCGDARDGSWTGGESRNLGLSEVGASKIDALCGGVEVAGEELLGASKIDALCGVEGKDVFGDVKVVGEEFKSEEVRKKNVVGTNLPTASGHIEGGFRQEDEGLSDDDWEGIERSDLEILFAKAINFVQCGNNDALSNLGSELKMQLYALQKTAMEGPCYEPQPMAFKVSARAKWNAWRRTGSMSSEAAMEQYVKLLSDTVPAWIRCSSTESCVDSSSAIGKTKLSRHSI
ncbi:PREDICTED: acyl-CoA-binding domain-containing protein 3-like isoform X2 [Ipomoea nil]|uniref:acyl-CoA-binding domain-containing protein 3-like isoform X2 n=1 Tax=Ipomoea nil TaxID=35883 RepID=UPI000900CFB8|nr:PREDICTED: acyl-CoA-binding domain-containing protein 3-like isoform X2 [Ipomoea nil]XP_019153005.1 PREDICTED: acyl-CoA-binding domain-containing protein 3-like isoform X2 [Ipomoea nil]